MIEQVKEIKKLLEAKKYSVAETKSSALLKSITSLDNYSDYVECFLIYIKSLKKNVKNLKALQELENVSKKFPYEIGFVEELFDSYISLKKYNEAKVSLKRLIEISPENIEYYKLLVNLYLEQNNYNLDDLLVIKKVIDYLTYNTELIESFSQLLKKEESYSEYLYYIKLLRNLEPDKLSHLKKEAEALLLLGMLTESINIILNYFSYKIEEEQIDIEFISTLDEFTDAFRSIGEKSIVISLFIQALPKAVKTKNTTLIQKFKDFALKNKIEFIFNSLTDFQYRPKNISEKNEEEFIKNIVQLKYNKSYFSQDKLAKCFNKSFMETQISKNHYIFVLSLLQQNIDYTKI